MTALTTSAMLVSLNISQWSARKHDKRVSSKVAREHNTSSDAGRYNKMLIAKEALIGALLAHEKVFLEPGRPRPSHGRQPPKRPGLGTR